MISWIISLSLAWSAPSSVLSSTSVSSSSSLSEWAVRIRVGMKMRDNPFRKRLEDAGRRIDHRQDEFQDADTHLHHPVRLREGDHLRHEIANENDDAENDQGGDPIGDLGRQVLAQQEEAEQDQRQIYQAIGEEDGPEQPARVFHELRERGREVGAAFSEALEMEGLEREKRRLDG